MSAAAATFVMASEAGVIACGSCGLVCRLPPPGMEASCPRCGRSLHRRKPSSIALTWGYLVAAALLYVPANTLPMMYTTTLQGTRNDTILGGVVALWESGSWDLALIVFVASVLVPVLKILALTLLLLSIQLRWNWALTERARLYRMIETIGRWSMLDIFVVALLIALVRFGGFGQINAGAGAVAFAAVAILTMLASRSFDPRLLWDTPRSNS